MACFRYKIVNTLNEGDNKDDDDDNDNNNYSNNKVQAEICRGTRRITQFVVTLVKGIWKVAEMLCCRKSDMAGSVQPAGQSGRTLLHVRTNQDGCTYHVSRFRFHLLCWSLLCYL